MDYNDLIKRRIPKNDILEWSHWIKKGFQNYMIAQDAIIAQNGFIEFNKRTICNIIHDTVCSEATKKYAISEEVEARYFEQLKLFGILFKDKCFIRINKLNFDYSISGHTSQKQAFIDQGHLNGIPYEIPRLILGYFFNQTITDIQSIHLIYWQKTALWDYDISNDIIINQKRIPLFAEKQDIKVYSKDQKVKFN